MNLADDAHSELVFIAGSPSELDGAAEILTAAGIEFATKRDSFIKAFLGGSVYDGIGFYVLPGQAQYARAELERAGLKRGVVTNYPNELRPVG